MKISIHDSGDEAEQKWFEQARQGYKTPVYLENESKVEVEIKESPKNETACCCVSKTCGLVLCGLTCLPLTLCVLMDNRNPCWKKCM
jgi:hypothetical protein